MAIERQNIRVAPGLIEGDQFDTRATLGILRRIADQLNGTWAENAPQLTTAISNPPTQAEVVEIGNKVNEIITALVNAGIMDPEP